MNVAGCAAGMLLGTGKVFGAGAETSSWICPSLIWLTRFARARGMGRRVRMRVRVRKRWVFVWESIFVLFFWLVFCVICWFCDASLCVVRCDVLFPESCF